MEKYKDVILRVLNNHPIVGNQNSHPNTHRHLQDKIKVGKVNFKLQEDKAELIQELKLLRNSYLKQKKLSQSRALQNKQLKEELSKHKVKLEKTQNIKNKMEKRLYSARPLTSSSSKEISLKSNSICTTQRAPIAKSEHYEISVQTKEIQTYDIGCQTEPIVQSLRRQENNLKQQVISTCQYSTNRTTGSLKTCFDLDKASFRTSTEAMVTQRLTGRIIKKKKKC